MAAPLTAGARARPAAAAPPTVSTFARTSRVIETELRQATAGRAPAISTFPGCEPDAEAQGLAFDAAGNLYVANDGNDTISKVTPAGAVSTFVSERARCPEGLAFDAAGNLYVANSDNNTISKVTPAGAVSTFVSSSGLDDPIGPGLRRRRQPLRRQLRQQHDLRGDARGGRLHLRQQRAR